MTTFALSSTRSNPALRADCTRAPATGGHRTGVLLIAHSPLASAFAQLADDVLCGADGPLAALDIGRDTTRAQALDAARKLAAEMDCAEWLVLVDIHGGPTPCVVAQQLCDELGRHATCLVGGLNAAMLLTALESRHLDVQSAAAVSAATARTAVCEGFVV